MAVPTQFAYRTSKGAGVIDAHPLYEPLSGLEKPEGNLRCCVYSPCGRYFAWASLESVTIIDASVGHIITTLDASNVYELGFSPLGTFIITWQRPSKDENGDAVKNLVVWRVIEDSKSDTNDEHKIVGRFVQKSQTGWNLQYTQDETYCARMVTNEVQFYESGDLGKVWDKLRVEGVTDFSISPGKTHSVAVFVPERKGLPAAVKIFNVPSFTAAVSQKTFYKADKIQLKWNALGTQLLVLSQTEVDKSNKNYYGEMGLYLLSANGEFDSRIDLDKEGPIYDVTWSPNSKEFGVVYGFMPAKTTFFNSKAVVTHNFDLGPRNTILFSPHGRFVIVGGFGNLAGHTDIYDLEKDYKKICTIQASNASVVEWSPDGKFILTATTSPRLRVDNGIRIWHVGGGVMYNCDMQELYHVTWRPQSVIMHPPTELLQPTPEPHASALAYLGTVKTPSKPAGAYRPPGARGTTTPLAFMREDQGGAAFVSNGSSSLGTSINGFGKPRRREVPGAEPIAESTPPGSAGADGEDNMSKAAAKNKKKREAKKAKDAAERSAGLIPDGTMEGQISPNRRPTSPNRHQRSPSRGQMSPGGNPARSPERRDRRGHDRNRSRTNSELRPQSRNRQRGHSQKRDGPPAIHPSRIPPNGMQVNTVISALAAPDLTVTTPGGGGTPQEKKIRALTKKLRAIDDLRMRRANGETLENTQVKKMETEDSVRKELESLGWTD